ncbi:hypothetical protein LVO39_003798 [Salmonella enterica]|uniref:hypothetical protein n=1 Tax=Salmonella enterica TaxID=28901 RepID=UPI0017C4E3EC|nr:hypothetical protein [Salmonella enterica]EDQ2836787.1 hypothetical protein [Salmonella enterica subsp. enterica]EDQ2935415.1 hypothetical protein [Salmonella enterica subsp. enterica serovar Oranienburg]EDR3488092.1 hypothetical protein [Salmonella enterica subsp. enterica serovar Midway]EDS7172331.1 hypothetical protein [Salmonella enterica subsp. enterica serovar Florida]EDV1371284.1 hypothetical protein [Salmonella enterica subsp. enterica serovar Sundsvall]EDW6367903.1 hypothetical pr
MQNNCSSLVMCFGATALIPAIFHFSCDLFQRHRQERHYCRIKSGKTTRRDEKKGEED